MIEKTFPITEKLLATGLTSTQRLLELLNKEFEYLKQTGPAAQLSAVAEEKKEAVIQLEQFSRQLGQILATEKLGMRPEDITDYFSRAKKANIDTEQSWRCWDDIMALSKKCRAINEQNGASIALLSRHTQRTLQILRGKSQLTATYGPDGFTRSVLFSHTLISV